MKLWLDDVREAPEGWAHARSVNEAIEIVRAWARAGDFEDASLDNDLGSFSWDGGDGHRFVLWMIEHEVWPVNKPVVHSMNPVRRQTMRADIDRYWS